MLQEVLAFRLPRLDNVASGLGPPLASWRTARIKRGHASLTTSISRGSSGGFEVGFLLIGTTRATTVQGRWAMYLLPSQNVLEEGAN